MIAPFKGIHPVIHKDAFIARGAVIIGDVKIESGASIWYGAVIRGDIEPVRIGQNTNIQDNCTIHTEEDCPVVMGRNTSVGHNAVIHGCTIEDDCLVGIGAVVLNGANVKKGSVVAAGSVVREGQVIGPYEMVAGSPAVVKKRLDKETIKPFLQPAKNYLNHAKEHRNVINPG